MAIWLILSGKTGEYEKNFIKDNKIYLTCNKIKLDLRLKKDKGEFYDLYEKTYGLDRNSTINYFSIMGKFLHTERTNLFVMLPSRNKLIIYLGKVLSECQFDKSVEDMYKYYRDVIWFEIKVTKNNFENEFLHSPLALSKVFQIIMENAEEKIKKMLNNAFIYDYSKVIKEHLGYIKESDVLQYSETDRKCRLLYGPFNSKGTIVYHSHIFCNDLLSSPSEFGKIRGSYTKYSYLPSFREIIVNYIKDQNIKLHICQRQLNSSQGLVLNFLVPIINNFQKDFTEKVFGIRGKIKIEQAMTDGNIQPTSVDFIITEEDEKTVHLFEAKYTEQEFGTASISGKNPERKEYDIQKYIKKWNGDFYEDNKHQPIKYNKVEDMFEGIIIHRYDKNNNKKRISKNYSPFTFFDNYQLIRNLYNTYYYVNKKNNTIYKRNKIGSMNVLIPGNHAKLNNEINEFRNALKNEYKNNVKLHYWEEIVIKAISFFENYPLEDFETAKLTNYYKLFQSVFCFSDIY